MILFVQCECGKDYYVPENRAGKRFNCYLCNRELIATLSEEAPTEAIAATPPVTASLPAIRPLHSSHPAEDEVAATAELRLRRESLRKLSVLRVRLGLGCMVVGATLCLGGLTSLAEATCAGYISATGMVIAGALIFLLGVRQWFRWWR